jgi:hypothetical protein
MCYLFRVTWPEPQPCKRKWGRVPFDQMLQHISKKLVSIGSHGASLLVVATVMENKLITSAFSRQHSKHIPPTTLLVLFEIISLAVLARVSWQRRGNKLLFYVLIFRDVPLQPEVPVNASV